MPRLGPGVRIEQINLIQARIGQLGQKLEGIVSEQPNIFQTLGSDGLHHLADPAGKNLAANIAGFGMVCRLKRQMLAAAITDFNDQPVGIGKKAARIKRTHELDFQIGQGGVEHRLLPAMQFLARPTAKKRAGRAIARFWQFVRHVEPTLRRP